MNSRSSHDAIEVDVTFSEAVTIDAAGGKRQHQAGARTRRAGAVALEGVQDEANRTSSRVVLLVSFRVIGCGDAFPDTAFHRLSDCG